MINVAISARGTQRVDDGNLPRREKKNVIVPPSYM
jgi:hypothetical protein